MKYDPPRCKDDCDETHSEDCEVPAYEAQYWGWYFGAAIKTAADSRRDLGLRSDATDLDVCIEALKYK